MSELINKNLIFLDLELNSKEEIIKEIAKNIYLEGIVNNYELFLEALINREKIAPTSIGFSVGIPHGKSETVQRPAVAFARLKEEVLWSDEAEEKEKAKLIFMLAIPESKKGDTHIEILSTLVKKVLDDDFREVLTKELDVSKIIDIINK